MAVSEWRGGTRIETGNRTLRGHRCSVSAGLYCYFRFSARSLERARTSQGGAATSYDRTFFVSLVAYALADVSAFASRMRFSYNSYLSLLLSITFSFLFKISGKLYSLMEKDYKFIMIRAFMEYRRNIKNAIFSHNFFIQFFS